MTTPKGKAAGPCQGEAAQVTTIKRNNTPRNALQGWFDLAANVKDSRINRQPKREWKRGRK